MSDVTLTILRSPNYFTVSSLTANTDSSTIDAREAATGVMTWVINQGQSSANSFTGSVGIQGSVGGTYWFDLQRTAVSVGPGSTVVSGTYGVGSSNVGFGCTEYRFDVAFTAGSGCSLTGSVALKG